MGPVCHPSGVPTTAARMHAWDQRAEERACRFRLGCRLPARALSSVDLPEAGGPSSSVIRPGRSTPLTLSSICRSRLCSSHSPHRASPACCRHAILLWECAVPAALILIVQAAMHACTERASENCIAPYCDAPTVVVEERCPGLVPHYDARLD